MIRDESEWLQSKQDINSFDYSGRSIKLRDVPIEVNKKSKIVRVSIDEVIKAEQKYIAEENDIEPFEILELLLLYKELHFHKGGYIKKTYRFNKMLFYLWKEIEKTGFGNSYIFDTFVAARAGPVPLKLKDSMRRLQEKSLVKAKIEKTAGKSSEYWLTDKGKKVAESLWEKTPDFIKQMIVDVKQDLMVIQAEDIKRRVHKEYPEYKRNYTDLDDE